MSTILIRTDILTRLNFSTSLSTQANPGAFQRIRIELANGKILDEYNLGIWANNSMPTQNEISSDLISIVKIGNLTLLMTYGWYFGSDPSEHTIFEFSSGEPRRIFGQNFRTEQLILTDDVILTGYKQLEQAGDADKPELYELRIRNNKLSLNEIIEHCFAIHLNQTSLNLVRSDKTRSWKTSRRFRGAIFWKR